jgi:Holliday junction resolvase
MRKINSRQKGARGERQWRDELRAQGFHARRGQQFAGGTESPDVVCEELRGFHFEVKAVEKLNIEAAMDQARRDGCHKLPLVAHRRSHRVWLVTMEAETFFRILRGDLPEGMERIRPPSKEPDADCLPGERAIRTEQTGDVPVSSPAAAQPQP